ncbi:flippase-like domain-containing protein [bacterium]|nr:flippase-like domain-containing protein [bacterium]
MRKKIFLWGRFVVSFAILIWLVHTIDWSEASLIIRKIDLGIAWIPYFIALAGMCFAALRWTILLRGMDTIQRFHKSLRFYLISSFYGMVMPGVLSGDIIRVGAASSSNKGKLPEISLSAILERVAGLGMVILIGTTALWFSPQHWLEQLGVLHLKEMFAWIALIMWASVIAVIIGFRIVPKKYLTPNAERSKVISLIVRLTITAREISIFQIILVLLLSGLFQFFDILATWILALALQIDLTLFPYLIIIPVVYLSTVLPISLGGLGVREGVLSLLLVKLNVDASQAVLLAFTIYLNKLLVGVTGMLVQWGFKKQRLNLNNISLKSDHQDGNK